MTVSAPLRWALLLTVAVSVFEFFQSDAPASGGTAASTTAAPAASASKPAGAAPQSKATDPSALTDADWPLRLPDPRDSEWPRQKLASSYGWEPAPPPPKPVASKPVAVVVPPPIPPQGPPPIPPFPYQMVGLLEQDGSTSAWLSNSGGSSTRTVVPEQVLDGRWRVGTISPRGMSVTWLQTGQTLQIKYAP